jgi:hypothetical protein
MPFQERKLDLVILIVSNAQDSNLMNNIEGARYNKNESTFCHRMTHKFQQYDFTDKCHQRKMILPVAPPWKHLHGKEALRR